jgi:bifunctional non-homologous end joining protein LigD
MTRDVAITHPERVLYPATGMTKADVVAYYRTVAHVMVPHLRGRPLMLGRWPEGVEGRGFGQFECRGRPQWMSHHALRLTDGRVVETCVADDARSLVWLANQGVIELHPYLYRVDAPDRPTAVVFDLDPGAGAGIAACCEVALLVRERLDALGLAAVVKTSGASGLHVFAPARGATFAETKALARRIASELARDRADRVTERIARDARARKVFVDWVQNDERRQTIAPYSLRAARVPRVSTPLSWDEVRAGALGARLVFGPDEVLERVRSRGDLFADALEPTQDVPG